MVLSFQEFCKIQESENYNRGLIVSFKLPRQLQTSKAKRTAPAYSRSLSSFVIPFPLQPLRKRGKSFSKHRGVVCSCDELSESPNFAEIVVGKLLTLACRSEMRYVDCWNSSVQDCFSSGEFVCGFRLEWFTCLPPTDQFHCETGIDWSLLHYAADPDAKPSRLKDSNRTSVKRTGANLERGTSEKTPQSTIRRSTSAAEQTLLYSSGYRRRCRLKSVLGCH